MGLLVEGEALSPEDLTKDLNFIREHGITQFLCTWNRVKDIKDDELRFGDEIECGILVIDHSNKTVKIALRGAELRQELIEKELLFAHESEGCTWHPEFGAWMIESTPSKPYTNYVCDLLRVERNMSLRRRRLFAMLAENEIAPTVTCFPLLGVGDFIYNPSPFEAPYSQSVYVPDNIINPHPRFASLVQNIRYRRQKKVDIRVPLFRDLYTPEFNREKNEIVKRSTILEQTTDIHMDAMAFGMGMCCLQVTFQARDVDESRYMYDQLAVLAPIMLAMTAASPVFKGRLANIDARWNVIAQSVDDRNPAELGELPDEELHLVENDLLVGKGIRRLYKSRYDSISTYIYHCKDDLACQRTFAIYNDIPCPVDEQVKQRLRADGVDENLAHHLAHLFTRDPIVAFHGQIDLNDEETTDHFESIQSTNWQTCRWKPPPPPGANAQHIGWRTEFRSMEVQLTDFENAAFVVFTALITRVVLAFNLAFYIPLSKVDENMRRAHLIEAASTQKFFFRKYMAPPESMEECVLTQGDDGAAVASCIAAAAVASNCNLAPEDSFEEMSMNEIFNGKELHFPGLIPLIYAYLDYIKCDSETFKRVNEYLKFIEKRAKGELITPATWMRRFILSHPDYQRDSVISPSIAHDLMMACSEIGNGTRSCPELLGDITIERVRKEDAYGQVLAGRLSNKERSVLINKLMQRAHVAKPDIAARTKWRADSICDDSLATAEDKDFSPKAPGTPRKMKAVIGKGPFPSTPSRTFN